MKSLAPLALAVTLASVVLATAGCAQAEQPGVDIQLRCADFPRNGQVVEKFPAILDQWTAQTYWDLALDDGQSNPGILSPTFEEGVRYRIESLKFAIIAACAAPGSDYTLARDVAWHVYHTSPQDYALPRA